MALQHGTVPLFGASHLLIHLQESCCLSGTGSSTVPYDIITVARSQLLDSSEVGTSSRFFFFAARHILHQKIHYIRLQAKFRSKHPIPMCEIKDAYRHAERTVWPEEDEDIVY
ncbi:hypothetical protein TRIUR3_13489 [Triticum urartu]|uniref:Uncharacterized protein n=1 Tax=Triticum urartu TaxID=4572 RepID=M7YNL6_TRIUA|nr:hypothetical protein TRIUR3_13489 [Triticum urartu]